MPVHKGKNYYQYGQSGKKYYYIIGNKISRESAKRKAKLQEKAIHARGYKEA